MIKILFSLCTNAKFVSELRKCQTNFCSQRLLKTINFNKCKTCFGAGVEFKTEFHSSTCMAMPKKPPPKPKNVIQFKPKSKMPVVDLWLGITPLEIADHLKRDPDHIFEALSFIELGNAYNKADAEIYDSTVLLAIGKRLGYRVAITKNPLYAEEKKEKMKDLTKQPPPDPKNLVKRPPVVAIMGHVDHGKTTLLDSLRHSSIAAQEHGGITQHIGAFTVKVREGQITFLDTPGHAAFKAMRARGAHATDIVVLVVAADDGIMEQTIESIRFAREAKVPIIVAINKIDKAAINITNVKHGLLNAGIQVEDLGGDVQAIPISALKKTNLNHLTDAILTQAEVMEIKGDPTSLVEGVVLEASMDTSKGKVSTALIQRGTLKKGKVLIAGTAVAKIRTMYNEKNEKLDEVTPGFPVQVVGWKSFPSAGDIILEATSERLANDVIKYRQSKIMQEKMLSELPIIQKKAEIHTAKYQQERQARLMRGRHRKEKNYFRDKESEVDDSPHLSFVLKGDVHGSIEAILDVVNTYTYHDDCRLDVIHSGVGNITENDLVLAETFNGLIYIFNLSITPDVKKLAIEKNIVIKPFNVIYHLIADMKVEISNRLPLVNEEDILGEANVLQEFLINEGKKKVHCAGCKCVKGILKKNSLCKVIRSQKVIFNGPVKSLRHEKADVESIKKDVECGLMVSDTELSFEPGDTIVCYLPKSVSQVTQWDPGF